MSSKRQDIIAEVQSRLALILTSNGYQTDAGAKVFTGQVPALSAADPEQAIAFIIEEDVPGYQGEHVVIRLPLSFHALVRADVDEPETAAEQVIADIKKAIETDHDLDGIITIRGLERGSTSVGIRSQSSEYSSGTVRYAVHYKELWGAP